MVPGDVVVCLGAAWMNRAHTDRIAGLKQRRRVKFVQLVHDVIPITRSSWTPFRTARFTRWLRGVLSTADLVLTQSSYSRRELLEVAKDLDVRLPAVEVIKFGTGFRPQRTALAGTELQVQLPGRYVLYVSTIEPRKNHRFLLRVWRSMIEHHGAEAVPSLVIVGRPAILFFIRLRAELSASNYLGGKVVILSNVSDAALGEVYMRCLFTVYPSLYEGWGLPVAESMALGKICAASNRTSLPEVGEDFIDYFDPSDEADAIGKIERLLFEPGYLAAREAHLKAHVLLRTWAAYAQALAGRIALMDSRGAEIPGDRC
jgi:glycosyltransferase involved in cell wall biosynthesis